MAREQFSNSVRAGVFVLTCLFLTGAVAWTLLRVDPFKPRTQFIVRFTLEDGVAGLARGSDVQVGGLNHGRVVEVYPDLNPSTGDVNSILVRIELDEGIALFSNVPNPSGVDEGVRVIRVASPLGNTASLNFVSVGIPKLDARGRATNQIPPGTIIDASSGSGLLAAIVGAENASEVGGILRNVASFTQALDQDGVPILANAREVVEQFAKDYETWRKTVTSALDNADQSLARVNAFLAPKAQVETFLDEAVDAAAAARAVMVEAKETAMPKVEMILDYAIASASSLDTMLAQAQAELTAQVPTIRAFLDNARETATQLKLATIEVRRNPWRLLNPPGPSEIANENLYQAAATFAMATSDLNAATETLRAVLADPGNRFASDPAFRRSIETQVLEATQKFDQARVRLGEVLHASPGSAGAAP
ncbi:MAG: hypothetical protein KF724_07200 [Phycisphaeraceae bacterium]|nr:hypothetical protein [Phycisphaeraceae bacterium]